MSRPPLARDDIVVRNREILESEVDGDVIALDIPQGECYGFNAVASSVWRLLEHETSAARISDALVSEFDVEREECEAEVLRLLNELLDARLIDVRSA